MTDHSALEARIAHLERQLLAARACKASPYKTPAEAAAYLRLFDDAGNPDVKKIYTLRCRYHLRARRVGGLLRFHESDLDSFAADVAQMGPRDMGRGPRSR